MFRSKRSRDQHLQTHSNKDNHVRLSMMQRLGLQPPQVHIHQQTQMHSSQVQPPAKRPSGVEPTFVHRTISQQTQMHSSQVQQSARRPTRVEQTFVHRTTSQQTQMHSSQVQAPARRPTGIEPTFVHQTTSQPTQLHSSQVQAPARQPHMQHSSSSQSFSHSSGSQSLNEETFSDEEEANDDAKLLEMVQIVGK
ncbi:hypothetical protein ACFE04_020539 [Oxalis oulophora]